MAKVNCDACSEIRELDPNLVVNGWSDTECASFKNDTGLSPSSGHNDCTDLELMNDCLIGNLDAEVDAYEVCDWKTFMHRFLPNLWTLFSAIKCAICGIWTNIHKIWAEIQSIWDFIKKLRCELDYMGKGASFAVGEAETDGSYVVAGKGCSFLAPQADDEHASDIHINYIAGGMARIAGSIDFHTSDFKESGSSTCYNMDVETQAPADPKRLSNARKGNPIWGEQGKPVTGGELVFELRILKSQYPQLRSLHPGNFQMSNGGGFLGRFLVFNEGSFAYGQHGECHEAGRSDAGYPQRDGNSYGHPVPKGWIYVQCRMDYLLSGMKDGNQYSPQGYMGIRLNANEIKC